MGNRNILRSILRHEREIFHIPSTGDPDNGLLTDDAIERVIDIIIARDPRTSPDERQVNRQRSRRRR